MKKCLLFHDWEQIEYVDEDDLYREIMWHGIQGGWFYVKKVCLRCGKRVDTITPKRKKLMARKARLDSRAKIANDLFPKVSHQ